MINLFGTKNQSFGEAQRLIHSHVDYHFNFVSPMLNYVEGGERIARREWTHKLTQLFKTNEDKLLNAWLTDRIHELGHDEKGSKYTLKTVAQKWE